MDELSEDVKKSMRDLGSSVKSDIVELMTLLYEPADSNQPSQKVVTAAVKLLRREIGECRISNEMEDLAYKLTEQKMSASDSPGTFTLKHQGSNNKYYRSSYRKLEGKRKQKPDSTQDSKERLVRDKAKVIEKQNDINSLDEDTQQQILQKIADNHNHILIDQNSIELTPAQTMVVRNWMGTSTNGMCRMK